MTNLVYLYLLAPLHTGGTTQEGNLLGIARESHTNLPYIPSSTIRGRVRASESDRINRVKLFGPELQDIQPKDIEDRNFLNNYELETGKKLTQLEQGDIWIGDGSLLWLPVPSLSHGVVWISCPLLLQRWARFNSNLPEIPAPYSSNLANSNVYLKDAILKQNQLSSWQNWKEFIPQNSSTQSIQRVLLLPDQHCATLIQMSLWQQVKVKLDEYKSVIDGSFRYEEAIPPDSVMYFPWGTTTQANGTADSSKTAFQTLLNAHQVLQIGGQESLGRGFVQSWFN